MQVSSVIVSDTSLHVLVEEDSGANDELEDVLQGFHGLQQLLCQLLSVVHIVFQDFSQLSRNKQKHALPDSSESQTDISVLTKVHWGCWTHV